MGTLHQNTPADKHAYLLAHHVLPELPEAGLTDALHDFLYAPLSVQQPILHAMAEADLIYPDLPVVAIDHELDGAGYDVNLPLLQHEIAAQMAPYQLALKRALSSDGVNVKEQLANYLSASGDPDPDIVISALAHNLNVAFSDELREQFAQNLRERRMDLFMGAECTDAFLRQIITSMVYEHVARKQPPATPVRDLSDEAMQVALLQGNLKLVRQAQHEVSRASQALNTLLALPVKSPVEEGDTVRYQFEVRVDFPQLAVPQVMLRDLNQADNLICWALEARGKSAERVQWKGEVAELLDPVPVVATRLMQFAPTLEKALTLMAREGYPLKGEGQHQAKQALTMFVADLHQAAKLIGCRSKVVEHALPALQQQFEPVTPQFTQTAQEQAITRNTGVKR